MDQAQKVDVGDEFTIFPKLAPELRIEIWKLALPPRTITIDTNYDIFTITESEGISILLHVNKEARSVVLQTYQLSFSAVDGRPRYFDFRKDTLQIRTTHIGRLDALPPRFSEDLSKVQNLKYHSGNLFRSDSQASFDNQLQPFKSLKNLIVHCIHSAYLRTGQRDDGAQWKGLDDRFLATFERQWKVYTQKLEESNGGKDFKGPVVTLMPREYYIIGAAAISHYVFQ
jgi:hypothetical protein